MGGSPTQSENPSFAPMMKTEIMEKVTLPDGSTYTKGGEMPYYGDKYPMAVPSNRKEPLRNMEYIKQEQARREAVKNIPEYTAVTSAPSAVEDLSLIDKFAREYGGKIPDNIAKHAKTGAQLTPEQRKKMMDSIAEKQKTKSSQSNGLHGFFDDQSLMEGVEPPQGRAKSGVQGDFGKSLSDLDLIDQFARKVGASGTNSSQIADRMKKGGTLTDQERKQISNLLSTTSASQGISPNSFGRDSSKPTILSEEAIDIGLGK